MKQIKIRMTCQVPCGQLVTTERDPQKTWSVWTLNFDYRGGIPKFEKERNFWGNHNRKTVFQEFQGDAYLERKNSGISGEKNFSVRCKNIRLNLNNLNNFTQI